MQRNEWLVVYVLLGAGVVVACSSTEAPPTGAGAGGGAGSGAFPGGASATAGTGGTAPAGGGAAPGSAGSGGSGAGGSGGSSMPGAGAGSGGAPSPGACGATPTGTGAAFPPVTDYAAQDGGFGPAVTSRNTGDGSLGIGDDGNANEVAIFRPAADKYGQGGVTHPIIVWGNGSTNTVDIWQRFLSRVASFGFVVVAPEQTQVTADHMNDAIDYVLALANDPASGDCGKIDTMKIGSTGYSRGGGGAISVGSDPRISTTFFFASNGNVGNLKAPWAVVGGDMDTIFGWSGISAAVTGSEQPAFGALLAGVDHNRVAGNAKAQEAYIGWMRWRFMGDTAGREMFVGATCRVCSDAAFSAVARTTTLDSL